MRDHRGGDQIVYGAVRILMLLGVVAALAAEWLDVPSDRYAFILYLTSWVLLSSGLLFAVEWGGALVMALVQIGDIAVLGYLTVNNGGNASPLAFLLLPHVIAMAIFVSRPLALFVTVALVLFHGYLLHLAGAMGFYAAGFWTAYGAALLSGAFCFMAVKNIQRYVLQYAALEDREKYLERSLTALEQKLDQSTVVDAVTGLNNFRYFRDRIDKEVKRAKRQKYIFSLCILSVDDLEVFDKRYGAAERDLALARISRQIIKALRDTDLIARFQSNGFAFLLPDTEPRRTIIPAVRLRDKLTSISFGPDHSFKFNISIGVAGFPSDAQDMGGIISLASSALRRSAQRGSNQITLASSLLRTIG